MFLISVLLRNSTSDQMKLNLSPAWHSIFSAASFRCLDPWVQSLIHWETFCSKLLVKTFIPADFTVVALTEPKNIAHRKVTMFCLSGKWWMQPLPLLFFVIIFCDRKLGQACFSLLQPHIVLGCCLDFITQQIIVEKLKHMHFPLANIRKEKWFGLVYFPFNSGAGKHYTIDWDTFLLPSMFSAVLDIFVFFL